MKPQTVLLTGATGFVGRQILKALAGTSIKVRLIVREGKQRQIELTDQIESILITEDIFSENIERLKDACKCIDTVIHAAWYVEPRKYLQSSINLDCLNGTVALAKACIQSDVRRFVGVGTCFEYDLTQGYLSVDTPLKPMTLYAAAKAAAIFTLSQYLATANVEFAWCRLFYLHGEGEDTRRLVPYLRKQLSQGKTAELTSGTQLRDFLDVREAGRMIAEIAQSKWQGPINVCSGNPITVRQLAESVADEYGRRDLLEFGKHSDKIADQPIVVGIK